MIRLLPLFLALTLTLPAMAQAPTSAPSSAPSTAKTAPLPRAAPPAALAGAPLAGWSDGLPFLRSPDNVFQLFPSARLQTDGYFFVRPTDNLPTNTFLIRRARIDFFGWIGPWIGFNVGGEFAAAPVVTPDPVLPSAIATADEYVFISPWKELATLQVGQFNAPFTLENRLSNKWFDFIERSNTVRAFGVPSNKEIGAMVQGMLPSKLLYYSVGVFNGDGPNFRNVDDNIDVMGRAWVAPFALWKDTPFDRIAVGGSFWLGRRGARGLSLSPQQTVGGLRYFGEKWSSAADNATPLELHQRGNVRAFAAELDAPITHRYGLRFEFVHKRQALAEDDISAASSGKLTVLGNAALEGWSLYVQAWAWLIGDDTIVGQPTRPVPPRFEKLGTKPLRHGLQVLARVERLDEQLTTDAPELGDPNAGRTTLTSLQLGTTYWYSKRYRTMFNYALNRFAGDSDIAGETQSKLGGSHYEHEFLWRLAVAL